MSFGRRLALFFVLIVLVPTLALAVLLILISEDSQNGKADARLAQGIETALALHAERLADAERRARKIASSPKLARGLAEMDSSVLGDLAGRAAAGGSLVLVEVVGAAGEELARRSRGEPIAVATLDLRRGGGMLGTLRVSTTGAQQFSEELARLTGDQVILLRGGEQAAGTVAAPDERLSAESTVDVDLPEGDFRARVEPLDSDGNEAVALLGTRAESGILSIPWPAVAMLVIFLMLAIGFAYYLAHTLTELHSRVQEQAQTDSLTGLVNRRQMEAILAVEVARAGRFGHSTSVLVFDVDDFKQINDRYGHLQGDDALRTVADVIRRTTRTIDVGARYGGDELALILLETDAGGAEILAERLRARVEETPIRMRHDGQLRLTLSVGVATFPDHASDVESLIDAADQALLEAKRAGKNRVVMAGPAAPAPSAAAAEGVREERRGRGSVQ